jgi:hypothetical protein
VVGWEDTRREEGKRRTTGPEMVVIEPEIDRKTIYLGLLEEHFTTFNDLPLHFQLFRQPFRSREGRFLIVWDGLVGSGTLSDSYL